MLLWGLNEFTLVKCLEQCLACSKHPQNVTSFSFFWFLYQYLFWSHGHQKTHRICGCRGGHSRPSKRCILWWERGGEGIRAFLDCIKLISHELCISRHTMSIPACSQTSAPVSPPQRGHVCLGLHPTWLSIPFLAWQLSLPHRRRVPVSYLLP